MAYFMMLEKTKKIAKKQFVSGLRPPNRPWRFFFTRGEGVVHWLVEGWEVGRGFRGEGFRGQFPVAWAVGGLRPTPQVEMSPNDRAGELADALLHEPPPGGRRIGHRGPPLPLPLEVHGRGAVRLEVGGALDERECAAAAGHEGPAGGEGAPCVDGGRRRVQPGRSGADVHGEAGWPTAEQAEWESIRHSRSAAGEIFSTTLALQVQRFRGMI